MLLYQDTHTYFKSLQFTFITVLQDTETTICISFVTYIVLVILILMESAYRLHYLRITSLCIGTCNLSNSNSVYVSEKKQNLHSVAFCNEISIFLCEKKIFFSVTSLKRKIWLDFNLQFLISFNSARSRFYYIFLFNTLKGQFNCFYTEIKWGKNEHYLKWVFTVSPIFTLVAAVHTRVSQERGGGFLTIIHMF